VILKCHVFGGKTGPFPMSQVIHVVRHIAMVRFRVEPEQEPTREIGPIANTTHRVLGRAARNCCIVDSHATYG